ncbi:hypothetical protein MKW92_050702 [Papaver armeniacum]|nr:hypothetical protein MKW92_050702 [Papaver armeniacum]
MDRLPKMCCKPYPLSPLTFLPRAASVYPDRLSIIYGRTILIGDKLMNDASALLQLSDAFRCTMAGAVLNAINTRLDANNIATILKHSKPKYFFEAMRLLCDSLGSTISRSSIPLVIVIDDVDSPNGIRLGELEYEKLLLSGNPNYVPFSDQILDEWDPITLNYTSGTTHRGSYLSTKSLVLQWEMKSEPVYLWSLPMFHCNGWTFTWGVAARGGTNVCIRNTCAEDMYHAITVHKVTHMCWKPNPPHHHNNQSLLSHPVEVLTGGAPPPAALLEKIEELGFHVTHAYGPTEATGPALVCEWQTKWNSLPNHEQSKLKARQGVSVLSLAEIDVKDLETMVSVPRDGKSVGEIVLREAFKNGWFLTGDVGVIHQDGYFEIKDRSKDWEAVLYRHTNILEAAVVAMPHPFFGETPCAFVTLRSKSKGCVLGGTSEDGDRKIQKFELRALAKTYRPPPTSSSTPQVKSINQHITTRRPYVPNDGHQHPQLEQVLAISRL